MPLDLPGACDCHLHVFEDGYPLAPTATFTPPNAPAAAYRLARQALGLTRAVVVQPTGYAFDNRCTLAAMATLGPETRGVAVVPPDVGEAELERLHQAGMRGVRFMMLAGGVLPWSALEAVAERIAPFGWHINLQLDGCELPRHEARLRALPVPLVVDHLGKFLGKPLADMPPDDPAFLALRRLLDGGRCWVKVSAPYESSRTGPPGYGDAVPLAQTLLRHHAGRCLWASNWPHPNVRPTPADAALLDWFLAAAGDDAVARRVLVDNPAALYCF